MALTRAEKRTAEYYWMRGYSDAAIAKALKSSKEDVTKWRKATGKAECRGRGSHACSGIRRSETEAGEVTTYTLTAEELQEFRRRCSRPMSADESQDSLTAAIGKFLGEMPEDEDE